MASTVAIQLVATQDGSAVLRGTDRVVIGAATPPTPPPTPDRGYGTGYSPGVTWREQEILGADTDAE